MKVSSGILELANDANDLYSGWEVLHFGRLDNPIDSTNYILDTVIEQLKEENELIL